MTRVRKAAGTASNRGCRISSASASIHSPASISDVELFRASSLPGQNTKPPCCGSGASRPMTHSARAKARFQACSLNG